MHNFQSLPSDTTEQGFLQLCDGKKKWKEVHCKLTNDTLSYSKLPKGLNATSVNLLNCTLYLGAEAKHSSPCEHNFTLRSHNSAKEDQMKVYGCRDSYDYWRWIWRIIHVRSKDMDYKLVSSKRASLPAGNNNRNSFIFIPDKHSSWSMVTMWLLWLHLQSLWLLHGYYGYYVVTMVTMWLYYGYSHYGYRLVGRDPLYQNYLGHRASLIIGSTIFTRAKLLLFWLVTLVTRTVWLGFFFLKTIFCAWTSLWLNLT